MGYLSPPHFSVLPQHHGENGGEKTPAPGSAETCAGETLDAVALVAAHPRLLACVAPLIEVDPLEQHLFDFSSPADDAPPAAAERSGGRDDREVAAAKVAFARFRRVFPLVRNIT